jgi:hypothetical protein
MMTNGEEEFMGPGLCSSLNLYLFLGRGNASDLRHPLDKEF